MSVDKSNLFKRQTTLPEFGEAGQERLQQSKVLIVGCGGLGSAVAVYLAASGIGKLHLVDYDKVSPSNLHRQVFYTLKDVGKYKSEVLTHVINQRAPFTDVSHSTQPLIKETVQDLINEYDVVVDGTDSLPTKYLLNDACVLREKPLVYGSLYKFDGYVSCFNLSINNSTRSANLRDAFPEMKTDVPNCEVAGTLNPIVGTIALAQVNEVIKLLTGLGKPLINQVLIYNSLENSQFKLNLKNRFKREEIKEIFVSESYFDPNCGTQNPDWLISSEQLKKRLLKSGDTRQIHLIAVLPNLELPFRVNQTIPINEFDPESIEIDKDKDYVMVCQLGLNSYKATKLIKEKYPEARVYSLKGGISAY